MNGAKAPIRGGERVLGVQSLCTDKVNDTLP